MKLSQVVLMMVSFAMALPGFAGETVSIDVKEITPLCYIRPHQAASGAVNDAVEKAELKSKAECGEDAPFHSEKVEMYTQAGGCKMLITRVVGSCYRQ